MVNQVKIAAIGSWLIAGAQPPKTIEAITEECAQRLNEADIPIDALILNGMFIHPSIRGLQIRWSKKRGVRRETFRHEYFVIQDFSITPLGRCLVTKRAIRVRLTSETEAGEADPAYNKAFRNAGYTDLLVLPLFNFDGTVSGCLEYATQSMDGFSDAHVSALRRLQSPLARMKEYFTERFDKQITLATYVGEATSKKVLNGQIVRGEGETISAVVLFVDLKGFTAMSNRMKSPDVLHILNRFFAEVDDAVSRNNGEILKFLGDGVLVIFPTPDDLTAQEAAAGSALSAVAETRAALDKSEVMPKLEFRAALHVGDLFFGNIGSRNRLDFTAIGPTVNLCSRMLNEASSRDAQTMCSAQFMEIAIGATGASLKCEVAGFDEPVEFFVLD